MRIVSPNFSDLLKPNIEIKQFPDGENYVRIQQIKECEGNEVVLFHRLYPDQDRAIIQLVLIISVLKKAKAIVTLVSPYLPYARQDKIWLDGEALSAETICALLAHSGVKKLITFDCHFLKKEGEFKYGGLKIKNISLSKSLIEYAKSKFDGDFLVISPDVGAAYMTKGFEGGYMKKIRGDYAEGDEVYRKIEKLENTIDFNCKNVLVIDDIISSGGTMIKAVENVKKNGAKKVLCAATHGLFLKESLSKLQTMCDELFTSDAIITPVTKVSIAPLLKNLL